VIDSVVCEERTKNLTRLLAELNTQKVLGGIVEVGVWRGGTLHHMASQEKVRTIRGFDTFTGIPQQDKANDFHGVGDFSNTSYEQVVKDLAKFPNVTVHQGWFPKDFFQTYDRDQYVALAHIDVDVYNSVLDCFHYLYPSIPFGGYVVFDDYGAPTCPGAMLAVHEILAEFPKELIIESIVRCQLVLKRINPEKAFPS